MTYAEAENYILSNKDLFEEERLQSIKTALVKSGYDISTVNKVKLRSPKTGFIISIILGWVGIDRFYAKSYISGIIKLLTCGVYGIWWIVDWFRIKRCIKYNNYISLLLALGCRPDCSSANIFTRGVISGLRSKEGRALLKEIKHSTKNLMDSFDINK